MIYNKLAKTFPQQLETLSERGLIIEDQALAVSYLKSVGYYRLSGYWWPMLEDKEKRKFKPQSTFNNVINIYNFDKELRVLLFSVIESIEIAFRTKLIYFVSNELSPWWFEESKNFKDQDSFKKLLYTLDRELRLTKENFIQILIKKLNRKERLRKNLEP